jgi:hypothetical protein
MREWVPRFLHRILKLSCEKQVRRACVPSIRSAAQSCSCNRLKNRQQMTAYSEESSCGYLNRISAALLETTPRSNHIPIGRWHAHTTSNRLACVKIKVLRHRPPPGTASQLGRSHSYPLDCKPVSLPNPGGFPCRVFPGTLKFRRRPDCERNRPADFSAMKGSSPLRMHVEERL